MKFHQNKFLELLTLFSISEPRYGTMISCSYGRSLKVSTLALLWNQPVSSSWTKTELISASSCIKIRHSKNFQFLFGSCLGVYFSIELKLKLFLRMHSYMDNESLLTFSIVFECKNDKKLCGKNFKTWNWIEQFLIQSRERGKMQIKLFFKTLRMLSASKIVTSGFPLTS